MPPLPTALFPNPTTQSDPSQSQFPCPLVPSPHRLSWTTTTTQPKFTSLTTEQLQRAYVKNKEELTKHVSSAVGAQDQYFGGNDWFVKWYQAPADRNLDGHNGLEHQDIPEPHVQDAIDTIVSRFERSKQQFNWVTGPGSQDRLEYFLQKRRFKCEDSEPVMAAELTRGALATCFYSNVAPAGVTIETVVGSVGIRDWAQVWAAGGPVQDVRQWANIYTTLNQQLHRNQFRMFIARMDGRAVGTGYIHCFSGMAAVHAVMVKRELRGRGIGRALMIYAISLAASLDYSIVSLTASQGGMSLFKSLGFSKFAQVKLYTWRPNAEPSEESGASQVLAQVSERLSNLKLKEEPDWVDVEPWLGDEAYELV